MKPYIYPSTSETARALILHLVKVMLDEPDRDFHIAFSGGYTPTIMFDIWAHEYKDITPWKRLKVYWVDERCVPPENSESNYGLMRTLLLGIVPIPYENVFRMRGEERPDKEAMRYSHLIASQVPMRDGWPVFDVVLLGVGDDGHTASIFPGQEHLLASEVICTASQNPYNGQKRVTLTGFSILNARRVIFLMTGKKKINVVEEICLSGDTSPAAFIAHHAAHVELFMDDAAASRVCTRL